MVGRKCWEGGSSSKAGGQESSRKVLGSSRSLESRLDPIQTELETRPAYSTNQGYVPNHNGHC